MNETQVTFTGWVGSDVTLDETSGGQQVASFRVGSTPRRLRDGTWHNGETNWFTVKAWRHLAVHVNESVRTGDAVVVTGRLTADVWTMPDGQKSTRYVVVATSVGHDLNKGTSRFQKADRSQNVPTEGTAVQQVIHSYEETGPNLDGNGDEIRESSGPAEPALSGPAEPGESSAA